MSSFEEREKMLIDKLSATDPLAQVAQVAKHLPQQDATKILRYATSTGDAPDVVAQNLKAYDMDSIGSTDWENALKDAPRTKTFLSTPLPLAIVQNGDNASVLANVESENKVWSAFKDGLKDVGRTTLRFGQGALEGVLSANDTPNPATPPTASEDYLGTRLPDNYTEWAKQTQHPMLQDAAYTLKDMADSKLLTPKNMQADTVLGQYGLDVIRMIPQIAAQLAVGATAGPATALGFMGAQIAGSDYENYAKEGVDPGRAMTAALGDAALQAPLEAVGLGKIMKKIPAGTAAKERVKKYLEAGLTEGVTEWLQQYPQGAADIYAKGEGQTPQQMGQQFIEDFWKNTKEGLYQGAVALPLGILGGAVHNAMQRQATKAYVENVEALQQQLAGSAILAQSPELVEQHLDAITGGEKAYIDPDALVMYQMENPKALEELGLTEQEVNAALQTGEMVEVTKAQYVTAAAQDPALHEALKNDVAPSTDGLTQRRIDDRKNEKDVKRATDKTNEDAKAVKDWANDYNQQLKEAGLSDDMAKQVMVGLQAHARTMSDNPAAWLRENAPEFRTGEAEQAGALQQAAKPVKIEIPLESEPSFLDGKYYPDYEAAAKNVVEKHGPNIALQTDDGKRAMIIHPSTKEVGKWQGSSMDAKGMIGDIIRDKPEEVVTEALSSGYVNLAQQGQQTPMPGVLFQPSDPTASPAFKAWFGDSKVVDEQGKPLVVYHTGTMGDSYDITKSRSYSGTPDYELPGIYLTADINESGDYGTPGQTKALYASIKNPYTGNLTALHKELGTWRKVMDRLKEQGYDGVVNDDDLGEIVAFSPEQIKSVNNSGAFDVSNPNIYLQSQMAYNISKEAGELYAAAAEKYPEIVADRKVKHRVENAIQQTLDFGQAEDDITRHETQLSLFGDDGKLAGDISGRETDKVQTKEKRAARQVGLGVTRELVNEGAVSLVGKQVHSIQELAEIAQVLRHPGYEKFHRVYADENDNIVYHETVSCMLPSEASVYAPEDNGDTINLLMRMDADIARLGAKKVYLIHNHPSTNPEPSKADIHLTKTLANVKFSSGRPGPVNVAFAGHIVLDTDTYAKIDRDGRVFYGHIDERYRINMTDAEIPHVTLGEHAYSPDGLAAAAKQLADGSRTTAFFMTTKGHIRGVVHLPDAVAKMDPSRISRYLRWLARANYSNFCSIATSDPDAFNAYKELVYKEHLADVLLTTEGRTVRRTQPTYDTWFGIPSGKGGKRLLETGERYGQDQDSFMANGSIHWENGRAIITMMQTGNPSTVIHEMVGHFFFQNLVERSMQDDAPEQVKKDVKTLFEWAGYEGKTFDKLTREERTDLHEKVARAAEVYVMEGKAPSVATQSLFRRFAEWMKEVYRSVRELGVQVTPEVAQVFDRMLATDAEIAEMEALERYHEALPETFLATLNDRQRAHLDQELLKVRAEAEEQLRAAVMRDLRADNRTAIAEERKTAQQQIRAELEAQPLYMARAAMQAPANMKAVQAAVDARQEQLIDEQVRLLVHHAKLGVEGKVAIRDDEGYMTGEWLGGFSNNEQWYKDLLARLPQGRLPEAWGKYIDWVKAGSAVEDGDKPRRMPPKMREAFREIAIEHLEKGWYDEQFGDIPANEEYLALRQSSPSWEIIMDNGGGLKLNEAQLAEMYPDKADKLPQNMLTKEGGFEADLLAQVFGFSSGDELLARIIDSPTLGEAVKERLQAHMQQFRELINNKAALQEEARAAMYSDGGAALLATELQLIQEKMGKVLKAEEARQAAATAREAAKRTAQGMLAKREINDATRLQSYIAAERRAAVDTAKYLKAKDYENAAAAKERQLINHALIMESLRIKRESERIKKYLNKQRKAKNWLSDTEDEAGLRVRTNEYRDQAASILARFGFVRKDFTEPTETLAEWVKRQEADEVNGEIINIAPWLAYDNRRSTIGKLTLEELQDVENAIRNIKKMATIGVNSDGFAFINGEGKEATVQTLLDSSAKLKAKQIDRIEKEKAGWLKDFVAGLKQGHRMLEALDAFKSFGPWYQTFYDSMKRAADVRSQLLQRVTDRLENAFTSEGITKAERYRMAHKQIYVREWGQSVTKNTLLAIALNMGNQGNLDRLTATRLIGVSMATPWDVESIKTVLERHLTAADFRLVGKIWKAIDVYDEYNSMVNRMTGNNLPKVEPLPIVFRPLGGEEIKLDGGYYPLSQDTRGSKQAELNAEKKLGETPGLMPYPSTGRSKSRTQGAKYAVDTDLANLYGNMTDIVQDIAFRPVAHDINKLMRDERVVSTIREKLGDPAYRAILEWERRITSGRAENVKHPLDQFFTWARSATVISSLLLRPGVAVQNLSNVLLYGNSVEGWTNKDAAAAYLRHGWGDYIPNALANSERAKALREYVYSKSVQMRDKKNAPDFSFREINDAGQQENMLMRSSNETVQELGYKAARAQESLNKFSSDVFAWTDQLTDIPIWLGAYEKAKADGKTETQAVNFADAIIRNSTGTGRNLDTAWMQAAGSPAMRLFTMFQTFLNTAYNRWAMEANVFLQEKDAARLIKFVACQYLAFGVLSALLSFHTPDEDQEWDEWFRKEVLEWPLGMIPLFGGLSKIMLDKAQGFKTYSYRMTPIAGKAEDVLKLESTAEKVWQGQKEGGELVEPTAALASFFLRYPDQLNDWFFNAYDALSGNMQPELRDLVRRRPKKERM